MRLLKVIAKEKYIYDHDQRLWITNCVVHEMKDYTDDLEWPRDILRWYFGLLPPSNDKARYHKVSRINEKINTALTDGKKSGLNKLKKVAREEDPEEAKKIIESACTDKVEEAIMHGFKMRQYSHGKPTNRGAGMSLYALVGENYNVIQNGIDKYDIYHYDDSDGGYGPSYKKWRKIQGYIQIEEDIEKILIDKVKSLIIRYSSALHAIEDEETPKAKLLKARLNYAYSARSEFEQSSYKEKMIKEFLKIVAVHSMRRKFRASLNENPNLVGVHNGILEFKYTQLYEAEIGKDDVRIMCEECIDKAKVKKYMAYDGNYDCKTCFHIAQEMEYRNSDGSVGNSEPRPKNPFPVIACGRRCKRCIENQKCSECDIKQVEFILHDGDNRHLFVSKSLGGCWRPNLTGESISVRSLVEICRTIMVDPEVLDHRFVTRGAAIFHGGGGMTLEANFGGGADGKTALSSCELRAGGYGSNESSDTISGYAVVHSPLVWQTPKKDANSHDAGLVVLKDARLAYSAEPSERFPYIDGQAMKNILAGRDISVRKPHSPETDHFTCKAYCTMELNFPISLRNYNAGNARRFLLIECGTKFYDKMTENDFRDMPNAIRADEGVTLHMKHDTSLHEAMIWIWAQGAMKFACKYKGQITSVEAPSCAVKTTESLRLMSDDFSMFRRECLKHDSETCINVNDLVARFRDWKRIKDAAGENKSETMKEILLKLSTSALAHMITDEHGVGLTATAVTAMDPKYMRLQKYAWK